jgi:hypothetical protein
MAQFRGGGARGVVTGARCVITVDGAGEMLVGTVEVMRGLPDATVGVALVVPVPGDEQLINSSVVRRQAQLAEKRGDRPARYEQ